MRLRDGLVRALRHAPRSRFRNRHDFGGFLPTLRTTHPRRQGAECRRPADEACQRFRLDMSRAPAHAADTDEEFPEAIVELSDVREHAHTHIVRGGA
jgi:hypothetical protein